MYGFARGIEAAASGSGVLDFSGKLERLRLTLGEKYCPACGRLKAARGVGGGCPECDETSFNVREFVSRGIKGNDKRNFYRLRTAFDAVVQRAARADPVLDIASSLRTLVRGATIKTGKLMEEEMDEDVRDALEHLLEYIDETDISLQEFIAALQEGNLPAARNALDAVRERMWQLDAQQSLYETLWRARYCQTHA